ncbi:MAG TPA: tRNA (N6-isopentenyl adenosine(37)-C2)-methylthiotransferase MiaB [Polyangiaceae bacterium]|nr:tRNA (N6-isopentenyl adenosine(37)-C2)-methylthiotransferase MiaB [Polyangiaceae bacterium]
MPSYAVVTFGCQMNQHDSDRIGEVLRRSGYEEAADPERADLVLLNTCSVREKAEQKLRSEVGRLGQLKRERPDLIIGVAGCLAQQEGNKLLSRMPQIDFLIGPDHILDLPRALHELEQGGPPRAHVGFDLDEPEFLAARPEPGRVGVTAFVTVMKGCDERCSFCIVPTTRGPERYRPARQIVDEIESLVALGVREVTLLGQTVNSYVDPEQALRAVPGQTPDESQFAALIRAIAERVPTLARLRYTSPHPRHLTPALIAAHAELPLLPRHVHLPVQSGSDRVLKRMIRRYNRQEYCTRVTALRNVVPGLTLSTDVIVGFPGETEEDFEATLSLVREIGFTGLFGFKYSPRPGTPALKLGDDIPEQEKSERLERLFRVSEAIRQEHLNSLVGAELEVLVEGRGKGDDFTGRSERNEIVHVSAGGLDPTGRVVRVRVEKAYKNSLAGVLLDRLPRVPASVIPARPAAPLAARSELAPNDAVDPSPRRALPIVL